MRLFAVLLMCSLALSSLALGREAESEEQMQKAWDALPMKLADVSIPATAASISVLQLDRPEVDKFFMEKIEAYDPYRRVGDFVEIGTVVRGNGARGCVWLIAAQRRLPEKGEGMIIMQAGDELLKYQEYVQLLAWLLLDTRGNPFDRVSEFEAPSENRDATIGDLAYDELCRCLSPIPASGDAARRMGWKDPFLRISKETPYDQREKRIKSLLQVLADADVLTAIRSMLSALQELRKNGEPDPMADYAGFRLARMKPYVMSRELLPKGPVTLKMTLEKEYPPWTEAETLAKSRVENPKFTTEYVVFWCFTARLPRNRDSVALVLLNHADTPEVIRQLIAVMSSDRSKKILLSGDMRPDVIELLAELARDSDAEQKKIIHDYLSTLAASAQQPWYLKQDALEALAEIESPIGGK